jgi:hypothetical protein
MKSLVLLPVVLTALLVSGCQSIEKPPAEVLTPTPAVFAPKQLERKPTEKEVAIKLSFYKVDLDNPSATNVDWGLKGERGVTPSPSSPITGVISPYKGTTNQVLRTDKAFADKSIQNFLAKQGNTRLVHDSTIFVPDGKSTPFAIEQTSTYLASVQCTKTGSAPAPGAVTDMFNLTFQPNVINQSEVWLTIKGNFSKTVTEPGECGKRRKAADLSTSEGSFFANALAMTNEEAIILSGLPDPTAEPRSNHEINVVVLRMNVMD